MTQPQTTKCRYCNGHGILSVQTPICSVFGGKCGYCNGTGLAVKKEHFSDCAQHNEPALPKGECDCGGCYA